MEYPYIRAWGRFMASYPWYISEQIAQAKKDSAPQDAIFKRDGIWHRYTHITNGDTRSVMDRLVAELDD